MPRQFPKFIYSNPKDTKSEGPFVAHLLSPKMLFKVQWEFVGGDYLLVVVPGYSVEGNAEEQDKVYWECVKWINAQMKKGIIKWQE